MASEPAPVTPLYDVHTHVLFDIDDGASDERMALDMLRLASERGVTGVVATPHSHAVRERGGMPPPEGRTEPTPRDAPAPGSPAGARPGMEVHLMPDVPELLGSGDYIPLNGTHYVLVEFDFVQWASFTDEVLFQISLDGYVPLLAHVERIGPVQEHPELIEELVRRGCFAQVTAASLLGTFGKRARRTAEVLIERGCVHVIASDAHRPAGKREPLLAAARDRLVELSGGAPARRTRPDRICSAYGRACRARCWARRIFDAATSSIAFVTFAVFSTERMRSLTARTSPAPGI